MSLLVKFYFHMHTDNFSAFYQYFILILAL